MSTYTGLVTAIALLTILLGLAMLAVTLANGFGIGVILGLLFVAAGAGRIYVMRKAR
jgi:hypothetical protein